MNASTSVLKAQTSARRRKPTHTYQSPSAADRAPTIAKDTLSAVSPTRVRIYICIQFHVQIYPSTKYKHGHRCSHRHNPPQKVPNGAAPPVVPPLRSARTLLAASRAIVFRPLYANQHRRLGFWAPLCAFSTACGKITRRRRGRAAEPSSNIQRQRNCSSCCPRNQGKGESAQKTRWWRCRRETEAQGRRRWDATYPAKRTRNPRGGSNLLPEDASPSDSMVPLPDVTPTPEPAAEQDDRRPERRTTRSAHGASKRRDSSASSSTASASVGTRGASKVNGTLPAPHVDPPSDAEMRTSGDTKEAKEEGEVSEEAP
ncbi:hypothetical protein B0H14DRAFT_85725 [Mycena olivaceomarginata]|nr:hypothetical protein B0H14DRAFT_85725 [Mycena olivaceomarginata]